jgi:hypothetical protein
MAVFFVHGVNTRKEDPGYQKDVAARDELIRRLLLIPLSQSRPARAVYRDLPIENLYWGLHGVRFFWGQATLPLRTNLLEKQGGANSETPLSDAETEAVIRELSKPANPALEVMGGGDRFREAAAADLPRFLEAVLAPLIYSEMDLTLEGEELPGEQADEMVEMRQARERAVAALGEREALVLMAADRAAADPQVKQDVQAAASDDEVLEILRDAVLQQVRQVAAATPAGGQPTPAKPALEVMGAGWFAALKERLGELFDRARGAPARALSVPALDHYRKSLHEVATRFFGDVFVYLKRRGTRDHPGPIVEVARDGIRQRQATHPGEPTLVITHSMGGNILYDLLTHYDPDLRVDGWVSVASQVGQFEEMKLFQESSESLGAPDKVTGLAEQVKCWVNVFDPVDPFAFKAGPVFADVNKDLPFRTGEGVLKAHGAYFKRPSFYHTLLPYLERGLP